MTDCVRVAGSRPDPRLWPPAPAHVLADRDEFEQRHGLSYCRRCGHVLVNDRFPDRKVTRACAPTPVELR